MIAAQKYETKECKAELRLINRHHEEEIDSLGLQPQFIEMINLGNHRTIRKMLESTGKSSQLVASQAGAIGIASKDSTKNIDLVIRFTKFMTWELCKLYKDENTDGECDEGRYIRIFLYEEGVLKPQNIGLLAQKASKVAQKYLNFTVESWPDYDFKMLILEAQKIGHGGILVFTDSPEIEVERFKNSCFPVVPFKIAPNDLGSLTAMDGALIIGSDLHCHAIGVILDGVASPEQADQSRGSRYNSAIRYYNHRKKDISILIIVVSDDGMINIIPSPDERG